jgi:hypothetical protein
MKVQDLEDLYRLSPVQEGMVFHALFAPASDVYYRRHSCTLKGELDRKAFEEAWRRLISRHPILRTSFHWEGLDHPLQLVHREAQLQIEYEDWRQLPPDKQRQRLQAYEAAQQAAPFNLSVAPLMRLTLIQLSDDAHRFIWSYHHLLMDGWSKFGLLKELFAYYSAFRRNQDLDLPRPRVYREYIAWLQGQKMDEAEEYWRHLLHGFSAPTPLAYDMPVAKRSDDEIERQKQYLRLSGDLAAELQALAQRNQVTMSSLLQGAWALLLSHMSGKDDVVFGVTVSGRPTELAGMATMVGVFINTLPLRVRISREHSMIDWLKDLQSQRMRMGRFEFSPLVSVRKWSDVPKDQPLFESIFVFGNYPIDVGAELQSSGLRVEDVHFYEKSNYPLGLSASPGPNFSPQIHYDQERFTAARIGRFLGQLKTLLEGFISQPDARVKACLSLLDRAEQRPMGLKKISNAGASLTALKPKAIQLSEAQLVRAAPLNEEEHSPLVARPKVDGVNLISWIKGHLPFLESELLKRGAILFRGFKVGSVSRFEQFVSAISPRRLEYYERTVRRTTVGDKTYTASEYPADHPIPLHNEYSFSHIWPMKLWFYCARPAEQGGETVIADGRKVFNLIHPDVRQRFAEKKVMYLRNFGDGFDLAWQDVFQSSNREAVERYCRQAGIEFEWKSGERLRTRQVRRATARHPKTGENLWFNQANLFHVSSLEVKASEALLSLYDQKQEDLPRHAFYGDGSPIEPEALEEIRDAYRRSSMTLGLKEGDILMVDNMLVAHGRAPFTGAREIVVAMAEAIEDTALQAGEE